MAFDQSIEFKRFVFVWIYRWIGWLNCRETQIIELKRIPPMEYHGSFYDILKLSHVAWPILIHQRVKPWSEERTSPCGPIYQKTPLLSLLPNLCLNNSACWKKRVFFINRSGKMLNRHGCNQPEPKNGILIQETAHLIRKSACCPWIKRKISKRKTWRSFF